MNPSDPKKEPENRTDESITPPHGDPQRAHLVPETDQGDDAWVDEEGPGPAEGHTDNKAGG